MEIGQEIKPFEIGCRDFDQIELINAIARTIKSMSWGSHAWRTIKNNALRFKVQGRHFKGHIYIALAWSDTFTIYFTKVNGEIIDKKENIYIDQLIDVIDKKVEYVAEYGNR